MVVYQCYKEKVMTSFLDLNNTSWKQQNAYNQSSDICVRFILSTFKVNIIYQAYNYRLQCQAYCGHLFVLNVFHSIDMWEWN